MKTTCLSSLIVLATALSLQAEAPRIGVQGAFNIPLGELKDYVDSKPAAGLGIHGTFDMSGGHMLRPRLDYAIFPEAALLATKQKASTFSLGGDYLYFIAEKPEGLYLTGGVAVMRWVFEQTEPTTTASSNTTKLGLTLGLGYQWNATVGLEARYLRSRVSSIFKTDVLQTGVTVRF